MELSSEMKEIMLHEHALPSREGGNPALFRIFWIPVFTGMTFGTGAY